MSETHSRVNRANRVLRYAVIVIVIFGLLIAFANLNKLKERFIEMDPLFLALALLCSCGVYLLEGVFLKATLVLFGERLPLGRAFKYSFVINALGYIISLGGLTPFATQAYILDFSGISVRKATHTRIIQVIFFNLFFNLLLITGFIFLIAENEIEHFNESLTIAAFCAFLALVSFFYLLLFARNLQRAVLTRVFAFMETIARVFSKRARLDPDKVLSYLNDFSEGFKKLLKNPSLLLTLIGITVFDWLLWIGVLYCSFGALRYSINPGILIIGFAVGQIVGIASMVPGGMGTLEGSMALVYSLFGIPFYLSLGAALLYRAVLYIIPFVASLPMHFSLRREE